LDFALALLTVQGMIEITLGGLKFPDGTLQTTAAISMVFHDASLMGNSTQPSPIGIVMWVLILSIGIAHRQTPVNHGVYKTKRYEEKLSQSGELQCQSECQVSQAH